MQAGRSQRGTLGRIFQDADVTRDEDPDVPLLLEIADPIEVCGMPPVRKP
jgi:hypothetical protein